MAPDLLTLEREVTHVSSEGISAEPKSFELVFSDVCLVLCNRNAFRELASYSHFPHDRSICPDGIDVILRIVSHITFHWCKMSVSRCCRVHF